MGFGTNFNYDIYLNRLIFQSKYDLENKIREIEKELNDMKTKVLMYSSSNPKDIVPEDWEEQRIDFIKNEIESIFEEYDDRHRILVDLYRYLEIFDEEKNKENIDL